MDLKDVRNRKEQLQHDITTKLNAFTEQTTIEIGCLQVVDCTGYKGTYRKYDVGIELRL